ncbi:hypothetical protein [Galbibacter pacificus]|uniref:WD40-like Beta Propeller Repeat n=1 Tax=Galbibacter pacificus TaxID=2996052 RepID=A0ABT6FRK9_9FLAO|nr:hypothetical protein [Galbibacter pacificus]MDG3581842.1 hypothetical protein [Galbibacter pacificus]MDG3585684.1 hypothetical protein [Galbibacter pacificus]
MKTTYFIFFLIIIMGCGNKTNKVVAPVINYPAPYPSSTALRFLPGIVSSDRLDFNAAFSRDGKTFYFSRSANGISDIYLTEYKDGNWSPFYMAGFSKGPYSEADPVFALNGSLYFISDRPIHDNDTIHDFNIWYVSPSADGNWSDPRLENTVNSDSTEFYISFGTKGNLYFASNRSGGYGNHDIYMSELKDGHYTTPINLGSAINAPEREHDPYISSDEKAIIFTSVDRKDSRGSADLYYSIKRDDGTWKPAKNLGTNINTSSYDFCPYVTPDGKYFFYSSERDVKWVGVGALPDKLAIHLH